MNRLSRSVLAVGGVILAGGLITFTTPKTVHALAAALVQVTNTAANPVIDADVTKDPSRIVELLCSNGCIQLQPGGGVPAGTTLYTVPAGQSLVITDVEFTPQKDSNSTWVAIHGENPQSPQPFVASLTLSVPDDGFTHVLQMQRGSVFASGQNFVLASNVSPTPSVVLHGYLANAGQ